MHATPTCWSKMPFDLCDSSLLQFPPHPPPAATQDKSYQQYQQFHNHQQNFNYGAWPQFNGFQTPGFSYNYNGFNAGPAPPSGASGAPPQQNWNHQQWNNWNYYGPNQQEPTTESQASSYQRTLEYVQQQSSWSANN